MIKFVGTTAVPKFDHGRTGLLSPDGAGLTLTPKLDDDPKRAMARGMALDRKFNSLSASAGDVANPLDLLREDTAWKNAPLVGQVFPSQSYFDPKIDSFLFNRETGDGVLLRRDEGADGSTLDVYANGFKSTDANGNSSFTAADTRNVLISGKAFEEVGARLRYLNTKYDPDSFGDRFLNLFTNAMDDPSRVMSANDRIERTALIDRVNYAADWNSRPEKYSPLLQNLDNVRSSGASNAIYTGAWAAGADEQKRRDLAKLGKAAGEVGFARASAVQGGPAYTGARGTPDLVPNNGVPAFGAKRIVPLGFERGSQFHQAATELQSALKASGIEDAVVGVRGSSVLGHSPSKGTRFGSQSDVDFFVESAQLTSGLKLSPNIPGFVHPGKILRNYPLLQDWSTNWSNTLGREITPGGFVPGYVPNQPIVIVR